MKSKWVGNAGLLALVLLAGCGLSSTTATGISEINTIGLAQAMADIQKKQALDNISVAIDRPSAIPSQMTIKQGTGIGNLSLAPTITSANLRKGFSDAMKPGASPTPLQNVNLGVSIINEAQFQVAPVVDANELHRIRDLFAFITQPPAENEDEFIHSPKLESGAYTGSDITGGAANNPGLTVEQAKSMKKALLYGMSLKCKAYLGNAEKDCQHSPHECKSIMKRPWLFWRPYRNFDRSHDASSGQSYPHSNDNASEWRCFKKIKPVNPISLPGIYPDTRNNASHYEMAIEKEGMACFDDFILFTQALTPLANASGDGNAAGTPNAKKPASHPGELNAPVSAPALEPMNRTSTF